jgi:signal transduction histidine kinase
MPAPGRRSAVADGSHGMAVPVLRALGHPGLALTWTAAALVAAVVAAAVLALLLWRERRALRGLAATVRTLITGNQSARAALTAPVPVRQVAQAVNALAEEGQRLRAQEAESAHLRAMAREVGFRIRDHLLVEDLLAEARVAIEHNVEADALHLYLITGADIGLPFGHEHNQILPRSINDMLSLDEAEELLRAQSSLVIQDVNGPDGYRLLKPALREALSGSGVVSHLYTPFGVDSVLGFITAERLRPGHPWTQAEIDAVQSIAADLGRGLHHARLYEAENRLVEDLRRLDSSRLEFFATVAHELRSPLTAIEGYVETLADRDAGEITAAQARMLEAISRRSIQLRSLVDDLLTLSKLETGAAPAAFGPVSLSQAIASAAEAMAPSAATGGVTLTTELPSPALTVSGDPAQLDRVLLNLLSNAVKYTPSGGRVTIRAEHKASAARIVITDTGIGIPRQDQEKLFTRFYRASNTANTRIQGTGLGLAIVAGLIENHHGSIHIASAEGAGTTVTVDLPLYALAGGWAAGIPPLRSGGSGERPTDRPGGP